MTVRRNLPATELARHACKDCGVNVIEIGEYYMVSPRLWEDKFHLTWTDNFCIGCLEARLGRKLQNLVVTPDLVIGGDFISFPKNPGGYENSARAALQQGRIAVNSILRDWVKAQITIIESGIVSFEAVFLPFMLTADGRTVIEKIKDTNLLPPSEAPKVVQIPSAS
jgi:hypothetical protein